MQETPFISVVIPTYNREKMLSVTIDSFIRQNYPKDRYEIIIANNNSTDNTQMVIDEYVEKNPDLIKAIFEKRQGVHYARNSAAHIAKGEFLYYTDDDMIAHEDLLKNLVQVFINNPEVASATGKVIPHWEVTPPKWVSEGMNNFYLSLNDMGEEDIISETDTNVFSCHQMLRRDVFFQSGGFNPEYTADEWLGDGETGLNIKIKKLGYKFAYIHNSVTEHIIPPSRMTQKYLNKRLMNTGNAFSYTDYREYQYSSFKLLMLNVGFLFNIIKNLCYILTHIYKIKDKEFKYRLNIALIFCNCARIKYNFKIMFSKEWREFILKYDWLNE